MKRLIAVSAAGIILPGALGAAVSYGLYNYLLDASNEEPFSSFLLFTVVGMAITAFPVLARILTERKLLSTTVGLMTLTAAAVNDICAWVLLALVISIINAGDRFTALYVFLACGGYAILLLVPVRLLLRKAFEKFLGKRSRMLTQMVLALIFVMIFLSAWTTEWIGVHAIFGAFLVGIIIPRMGGITMELTEKLEDVVGVAFLPLYFASSGLKTKLGLLNDLSTWLWMLLVIFVACAGKIIGCTAAAKLTGFQWRESFSIGILMNSKGLVELIVLNIGLDAGVINDRVFVVMVVMALVTTFMTSPIIAYVYPPKYHVHFRPPAGVKVGPVSHTQPKFSLMGTDDRILVYLDDIDSVPLAASILNNLRASVSEGRNIILNGLRNVEDFERSSSVMVASQAQNVIDNDPSLKMFRVFGKLIGAETKCFVATSLLSEIGVEVDQIAADQNCNLVIVPWQKDPEGTFNISGSQEEAARSILKDVHTTVAIFIDRQNRESSLNYGFYTSVNRFPSGILVPFIGGPADRAALQLAIRFLYQSKVRLLVLHLDVAGQINDPLDIELLDAFKAFIVPDVVMLRHLEIGRDTLNPVREILKVEQGAYDLVILGRSVKSQGIIKIPTKTGIAGAKEDSVASFAETNLGPRKPSFRRSLSQWTMAISVTEEILGGLGEMLFSMPGGPSLMVVHQQSLDDGTYKNGNQRTMATSKEISATEAV